MLGRSARRSRTSSRVTPGPLRVDQRDDRSPSSDGRHQQPGRLGRRTVTPILRPVTRAVGVRRRRASPGCRRRPRGARGEQQLAGGDAGQQRRLLLVGARARPGSARRSTSVSQTGRSTGAGADLAQQHGDLGEPEPLAAVLLGDRRAPSSPASARRPRSAVAVEHVADARRARQPALERLRDSRGVCSCGDRRSAARQNCNLF